MTHWGSPMTPRDHAIEIMEGLAERLEERSDRYLRHGHPAMSMLAHVLAARRRRDAAILRASAALGRGRRP